MGESLVDGAKPDKERRVTWLVLLEETTVGSGGMAEVLSPDGVVADLEFVVIHLIVEVEEVAGLERGTRVAAMLVAGTPGLALAVAVGGKVAVVVVVTGGGSAPPGRREIVRDSSRVVLVGSGVRVVLLCLGALD